MSRPNRATRSKADLKLELNDQLLLLRSSCETFDKGIEAAGKQISVNLRLLLHANKHSRALLDQLGFRTGRYHSSAAPRTPGNMCSELPLLVMSFDGKEAKYAPLINFPSAQASPRLIPFAEWWSEVILKDAEGRTFTRLSLVQHVADTDGGAHVGPMPF